MGFSNPITGGQGALIRPAIKSPNYVPGVQGWTINRDGTAEFASGQFRGAVLIGQSPSPRIFISTQIPAPLVNFSTDFVWTAAIVQYYNADSFYFNAMGTYVPFNFPVNVLGSYDSSTGKLLFNQLNQGPGSGQVNVTTYGSDTYNVDPLLWIYRNGAITYEDSVNVSYFVPNGVGFVDAKDVVVCTGSVPLLDISSSGAAAVVAASGANGWSSEPSMTFQNDHLYRITVLTMTFANVAGNNTLDMFVRKGSATTSGQILAQWSVMANNTLNACSTGLLSGYVQNVSGADITTALSLSMIRSGGANTVHLNADNNRQTILTVHDMGSTFNQISNLLAVARSIT